jgi:hypothetical protein
MGEMKSAPLVAAAVAILGVAAFLLLSGGSGPRAEGPGVPVSDGGVPPGDALDPPAGNAAAPSGSAAPVPAPVPAAPPPARPERWRDEKDGVPPRPPVPLREGVTPGEIRREDLPGKEAEAVEETRRVLQETDLGKVEWRSRSLRAVAAEIAEKAGVAVELEGDDLADEPVGLGAETVTARVALEHIAGSRALRFEILPGKVVIRR